MKSWTSMDKFTAIEMSRAGATAVEIGRKIGRTKKSVDEWFKRQREQGYAYRLRKVVDAVIPDEPIPHYVLAELRRRAAILPTLDHMLTGTPLPTCSALDRPAGLYYAR